MLSCDSCSLLTSYGVPQIQGMFWFLCYPVIVVASWLVMEYLRYKVCYGSCISLLASYRVPQIQGNFWFLCYPVIVVAGLPRSGKKFWKMKNFPGQGKSGKSQGITFSVREILKK